MGFECRLTSLCTKLVVVALLLSLTGCSLIGLGGSDSPSNARGRLNPASIDDNQQMQPVPVLRTKQSQTTTIQAKRSSRLPTVELVENKEVKKELDELKARPKTVNRAINQSGEHIETLKQIFTDEGVPSDLMNVALVESGFNADARSPMGATGMWQFMKSTAKYYGLKINFKEDQRKDIVLSTLAAARHLRDLYNQYQDWYLALAAYNMGVGGLERAMAKAGTRDFWELSRKGVLPKETARYVPKILAAAIIMKDPTAHGFNG